MSFNEGLAATGGSQNEEIQLVQCFVVDLESLMKDQEELMQQVAGRSQEFWSPIEAYEAADVLQAFRRIHETKSS
jgi:hypothetical protein